MGVYLFSICLQISTVKWCKWCKHENPSNESIGFRKQGTVPSTGSILQDSSCSHGTVDIEILGNHQYTVDTLKQSLLDLTRPGIRSTPFQVASWAFLPIASTKSTLYYDATPVAQQGSCPWTHLTGQKKKCRIVGLARKWRIAEKEFHLIQVFDNPRNGMCRIQDGSVFFVRILIGLWPGRRPTSKRQVSFGRGTCQTSAGVFCNHVFLPFFRLLLAFLPLPWSGL